MSRTPTPSDAALRTSLLAHWRALTPPEQAEALACLEALESPRLRATASLPAFIATATPEHAAIPAHLRRLVALLERAAATPTLALVSMPPRHGKSVTVTAALAWMVARWPARLNAYVTYNSDLARAQSRRVRRLVRAQGVPLADDAQRLDEWRTTVGLPGHEGGLCAAGITSGLTGRGFDGLMVVDDPLSGREEAESPAQREKMWEGFTSDVFTRLNPGGSIVVVATRWHLDDLIGRLEAMPSPRWEVLNLPAVADPATGLPADDGAPLWPERFPLDALARIRAMDEYGWASLYQGHPVPRGGLLFRVPARYVAPAIDDARIVAAVDPAGSASTRADHTAAVVLAVRGWGAAMTADVLEVLRLQAETDAAARALADLQRRHGRCAMVIEASRDGKAIRRALESIHPDLRLTEVPVAGDKFTRAQPVAAAWNQGRVRLPRTAPWVADLIGETERFTGVADKHDDQVDALAYAWNTAAAPVEDRTAREETYEI